MKSWMKVVCDGSQQLPMGNSETGGTVSKSVYTVSEVIDAWTKAGKPDKGGYYKIKDNKMYLKVPDGESWLPKRMWVEVVC